MAEEGIEQEVPAEGDQELPEDVVQSGEQHLEASERPSEGMQVSAPSPSKELPDGGSHQTSTQEESRELSKQKESRQQSKQKESREQSKQRESRELSKRKESRESRNQEQALPEEKEAAAVAVQSAFRGTMVRKEIAVSHLELDAETKGELVQRYEDACAAHDLKPKHAVVMSLQTSIESHEANFYIDAPGNHKHSFTSRLDDRDMRAFANAFQGLGPFLARLDLSYNHITDVGASILAQSLVNRWAVRLTSLSLRSNSLGTAGCQAICKALKGCKSLLRLDLSHNSLGRQGGLAIVELLRVSPQLLELQLQDTEADIDVLVATAEALLDSDLRLSLCQVENARLSTLQEEHVVHWGRMLRVNTSLHQIYLGKVRIRDEGIRQLVSFLLENKTLRVLDLRCNEIGVEGGKHLGNLLSMDCRLSVLNLCGNRIGELCNVAGVKAIADALQNNCILQHLDLNYNSLCPEALKVMADAVDQNSTLEAIALFHNQWDQVASHTFHHIFSDQTRILPLHADFVTHEVDDRIDICKADNFNYQFE